MILLKPEPRKELPILLRLQNEYELYKEIFNSEHFLVIYTKFL